VKLCNTIFFSLSYNLLRTYYQTKPMANEIQNLLLAIDREIASIDSEMICKGRIIDMLRNDAQNPPNRAQIEQRLNNAMSELSDLVIRRNILVENKMTLGANHINNGGAAGGGAGAGAGGGVGAA
jgi:hypothetical protein